MGTKTASTVRDLELMPDDDSVQVELDEGELVTMPPAGEEHGFVELDLARRIANHVKQHSLGRVYGADTGFILKNDTMRAPDISFVRKDRVAEIKSKGFAKGAPDLAVEIFSPSDSVPQLMRKVHQYLKAGCHVVWVVYPDSREVHVLEANGADRILNDADNLEAPDLLPGFSIKVAEIFED